MKILYTAAIYDSSGYAEAARNYIAALLTQPGIEISCRPVSFEDWRTDLGYHTDIIKPTLNKSIQPDIQIIHLTPENFPRCILPGIKNIGYTVWETTRLPSAWVGYINKLDEVWVPCDWNKDVFRASGVTIPIKKIPHTIDLQEINRAKDIELEPIPKTGYRFYSIFQWSARKNPEGLIKAYLSEFAHDEPVTLVLKTYIGKNNNEDRTHTIDAINSIKRDLQLHNEPTPRIKLIHGGLSRDEMISLHRQCDCFVLPHRAEGWGVPHFEAMAVGNPVITTGFSGNLEFMNGKTSYLVDFSMTPVSGMGKPTYNGKAEWAEPNLSNLRYLMRDVFSNQAHAKEKGLLGREYVSKFNWDKIGKLMVESL